MVLSWVSDVMKFLYRKGSMENQESGLDYFSSNNCIT